MSVYHSISVGYVGDVDVRVRCDDYATVYINGIKHDRISSNVEVTLAVDFKLLAIKCVDTGGFGGFMAVAYHNGKVLVSDGQWTCKGRLHVVERYWYSLDFDDSNWLRATAIEKNNSRRPRLQRYRPRYPNRATWIWIDRDFQRRSGIKNNVKRTIYCRSPGR